MEGGTGRLCSGSAKSCLSTVDVETSGFFFLHGEVGVQLLGFIQL